VSTVKLPYSNVVKCKGGEMVTVIFGDRLMFSGKAGQREGKVEKMKFSCSRTGKGEVTFYPELVANTHSEDLCADCNIIKLTPPKE
jgi:hypothetical protein